MEKRESIPAVAEDNEDFLIDLGAASVETKGPPGDFIEVDSMLPTSALTD